MKMKNKCKVDCPGCDCDFKVEYNSINIVCPSCSTVIGFHSDSSEFIPKSGDEVIIPKHTVIKSTLHGLKYTGKQYNVKVHHILNGSMKYQPKYLGIDSDPSIVLEIYCDPSIVWAGSGGYWVETNVNNLR
jgi:hypothetical protein